MKKDAYYFPHFSNARNDSKIIRLRRIFGIEGYGIFFMLLEVLREQADFKCHLNSVEDLAFEWHISKEKINSVINDFDLFDIDQNMFFSAKLVLFLQPYIEKSERAREAINKRWTKTKALLAKNNGNTNVYTNVLPQYNHSNTSKVKESKVKESKVKERNNDAKHLFCRSPYFEKEIFIQSFDEKYRVYDLEYYYEILKNYSESHGKMYNNWLAAARNWLIRDINDGKAHKINSSLTDDQQKSERLKAVQQAFEKLNQGNNGN